MTNGEPAITTQRRITEAVGSAMSNIADNEQTDHTEEVKALADILWKKGYPRPADCRFEEIGEGTRNIFIGLARAALTYFDERTKDLRNALRESQEIAYRSPDDVATIAALQADNVRLFDLVRFARIHLHDENAISDEEYGALMADPRSDESVKRLANYDKLRASIADARRERDIIAKHRDEALQALRYLAMYTKEDTDPSEFNSVGWYEGVKKATAIVAAADAGWKEKG
jgi:hypothetical protein